MSTVTSGSFVIKASRYTGPDPVFQSTMNSNPELFNPNQMIRFPLSGLRGNYKFTIKYIYCCFNKNFANLNSSIIDSYVNPQLFFVSPQICSYATNENFATIFGATSSISGVSLGGNMDHKFVANVDGYLSYNIIWANPAFGFSKPYPAINPYSPYNAGFSANDTVQPYFGSGAANTINGPLTIANSTVLIDWEKID